MALSCAVCFVKWAAIIGIGVFLIHFWITNKEYLFSHDEVAAIAKRHPAATGSSRDAFRKIYEDLRQKYPGHILPNEDLQWVFHNSGGWMGSMCIVHASVTEYVLFFGTAIETAGHSGRYWANITDTLIAGEFYQWPEAVEKVNIYKTGDTVNHGWGEAAEVNFKAGTWMVEYGRGFIPSTLGFAFADTLFSTQDFLTMFYVLKTYCKSLMMEAGYYLTHTNELFG